MAEYIDDSGAYERDAELTGTYTTDAANKVLEMSANGSADTGFTLPNDTDWLLVEVYDVNGTAGHIGFTKWQSDSLGNMGTDVDTVLSGYYTTINAEYGDSTNTFKAIATLYDTSASTATVMEADDTAGFDTVASPSYTKTSYTPPTGTWKITDTLVAPIDWVAREVVWISLQNLTPESPTYDVPDGETVNIFNSTASGSAQSLVDITNSASDYTFELDTGWENGYVGTVSGDNSGCQPDYLGRYGIRPTNLSTKYFYLYLPVGTFEIQLSNYASNTSNDYNGMYTIDSVTKYIEGKTTSTEHCATWTVVVSTAQTYTVTCDHDTDGAYGKVNGIIITEVAAT